MQGPNNIVQGKKSFQELLTKQRLLALDCNFVEQDEMIHDRLVFDINSQRMREKLFNEGENLSLDKATQICQ